MTDNVISLDEKRHRDFEERSRYATEIYKNFEKYIEFLAIGIGNEIKDFTKGLSCAYLLKSFHWKECVGYAHGLIDFGDWFIVEYKKEEIKLPFSTQRIVDYAKLMTYKDIIEFKYDGNKKIRINHEKIAELFKYGKNHYFNVLDGIPKD